MTRLEVELMLLLVVRPEMKLIPQKCSFLLFFLINGSTTNLVLCEMLFDGEWVKDGGSCRVYQVRGEGPVTVAST